MGKFSLGYQVLTAVILAIFAGLFFGPLCAALKPIAMTFTMLLQLLVLPYICFSLIHGLGSLPAATGKKLFKTGWPFLVGVWVIVYFVMAIVAQLIPKAEETIISIYEPETKSNIFQEFVRYIVPENLIYDLANNIVPAVAVFGLIAGSALMHMEKKEPLVSFLDRNIKLIEKALYWLALISPIGAFAHIALAVGTVRFEDLNKIEFFVICYSVLCLFMTFWILPLFVSCLIPMSFRDVLLAFRRVCLLPFVTGLIAFAIPFLNSYLRDLAKKYEATDLAFNETSQTILPLAYSFGQIGNCIVLYFLFFLSFYYRHPFTVSQEGLLTLLSIPLSIGTSSSIINSVAFMIQHLHLPSEAFTLFTETSAVTMNFQVLMSTASVLSLILLALHAYYGVLRIKWSALFSRLGTTVVIFCALILSIKPMINITDNYKNLYMSLKISDVIANPVKTTIYTQVDVPEGVPRNPNASTLGQIIESRVLKVGYNTTDIPYAYRNSDGQVVGYDIAYAYELASDLNCQLELIRCDFNLLHEELQAGLYDLAMAAILMTEDRLVDLNFTHPYHEENVVLVVPVSKKKHFMNLSFIMSERELNIGAIGDAKQFIYRHFPYAKVAGFDSLNTLEKNWEIDAWLTTRNNGFTWCLSHPNFVTIDYGGLIGKAYFSYPVRDASYKLVSFLNNWLMLKQLSGFQKEMIDYWIEGSYQRNPEPRWSILRDILHVGT
jgi:Na+/H+-dicarboxylate symporter/ABC-type amino acid transport substrate-binding protein